MISNTSLMMSAFMAASGVDMPAQLLIHFTRPRDALRHRGGRVFLVGSSVFTIPTPRSM
ncbi:MAG TPA: hypothetical protein VKQ36_09070 [Ktedonobacterales bacterium]|nr:hypothetical protein [Ktedonobacterales bacterium]